MAKINHAKLNSYKNTAPYTPMKQVNVKKGPEWVCSITDTGGLKLQCKGSVGLREYLASLTSLLKNKNVESLRWPTLYFGADLCEPAAVTTKQKQQSMATVVTPEDDVPWLL